MNVVDTVLFGFVCLLAVYGGLAIIIGIVEGIRNKPICSSDHIRVVLLVKDAEDNIEEIVRNAFRYDFQGKALSACNLAVVDLGSRDDTLKILERLGRDYQFIDMYTADEKDKVFFGLS